MRIHQYLMKLGHFLGCHQLPERSFFLFGRQFPVCARCTGLVVGYISAIPLSHILHPNLILAVSFCTLMLFDWYFQWLGILQSTNARRVVTGALCGYGLMSIYISVITWIVQTVSGLL